MERTTMPKDVGTSRCRGCEATILWARTKTGSRIPLDAEPTRAGNVAFVDGYARVFPKGHEFPQSAEVYMPHWATCPKADSFRGPAA
jgi:hypothetical protein